MIEAKVTAATVAAAVTTFVLWVLATYVFGADVPDAVAGVVAVVVPAAVTFAAGYVARHTPRPDLTGPAKNSGPATEVVDPPSSDEPASGL